MKYTAIIGSSIICKKSLEKDFLTIEGIVSMELSKRDFDICPPSAFKIEQYMINPQVWYNHDLWNDEKGNQIPIGKTLELYAIREEELSEEQYAITNLKYGNLVGYLEKEKAEALKIKSGDLGLWTKIQITVPDIMEKIDNGELNAFSWQGRAEIDNVWSSEHGRMVRQCSAIDLMEISVVAIPANEKSYFMVAKSFIGALAINNDTLDDIEKQESSYDYVITGGMEGHYHVAKVSVINGMVVGRTFITAQGEDHVHPINAVLENPVTGVSNIEEHFHNFSMDAIRKYRVFKGRSIIAKLRKYATLFEDLPIASIDTKWEFSKFDLREIDKKGEVFRAAVWFDENKELFLEQKDEITNMNIYMVNPEAIQLIIAKFIDGNLVVVWEAVVKAMAQLFGANGGVNMTTEEFNIAYDHLVKYYKKFGEEAPEKKSYNYLDYKRTLLEPEKTIELIGFAKNWIKY